MGRWTNEYQDTVLTAKLKGLVGGAIKRAKLEEKSELISYKHFVEDLDLGDSFTTTIIDILVQEMAARRSRSNPSDRRLIADQTAKNLRMLSTPLRVYQEREQRTTVRRRMSEYLSAPPQEMDLEEEDELASPDPLPEGIRVNDELFDAYSQRWARRRTTATAPTPPLSDDIATPPASNSPPSLFSLTDADRLWNRHNRPPSLRRLNRSRGADFNSFTAHRRSVARDSDLHASPPSASSSRTARRFFPSTGSRRHQSLQWVEAPPASRIRVNEGSSTTSTPELEGVPEPLSFPSFFADSEPPTTTFYSYPSPSLIPESQSRPRLRRGGVRPPESLLFGHDSRTTSDDDDEAAGPVAQPASTVAEAGSGSYPTPGSSAGETEAPL
ncbi:hypothetical protein MIND_00770800 [Mycena indigotica]|uniref:Uncharacterized protein n=1 Tax=Mycena indigotica TaxID=2126181 RepID=A0A8H6SMH2_9AGAR|nr:uncharacterized protein MIND_00770800 [Mycena indigotica]KAF7302044.1 hypothetical protein MIND_00770800 [Mycena indigotica]